MFQPGQAVLVNRPTHFPHIKQGEIDGPDPDWPGFWRVRTSVGVRYLHTSELEAMPVAELPAAKPRRRPKGPPRTILVPPNPPHTGLLSHREKSSTSAGPDTSYGSGIVELYD